MADKKIALDLEVNIKKGDITLDELNNQFKQIGETIEDQKDILIEFERELLEIQKLQSKTISSEYGKQAILTGKENKLKEAIQDQKISLKELNNERRRASSAVKDLSKESISQTKITQGLDKLTGGMATKVTKLYKGFTEGVKGVKAFSMGLSGMKKALIATGIGALVVALGVLVAYWEEINDFISGGNKKIRDQIALSDEKLEKSESELKLLELQESILKEQGLSTAEIVKQKRILIEESREENRLLLENLKLQREKVLSQLVEGSTLDNILESLTGAKGIRLGRLTGGIEDSFKEEQDRITESEERALQFELTLAKIDSAAAKKIKDAQKEKEKADDEKLKAEEKAAKEAEKAAKEKAAALEAIRLGEIDTEDERRQEELDKVDKHYHKLIEAAKKYGKSTAELEDAREAKKIEVFDKQAARDAKEQAKKDKKILKDQEALIKKLEADEEQEEATFEQQREDIARREAILLEDKTLTLTQRNEVEAIFSKERKEIEKGEAEARIELNQQRVDLALATLGALNGLVQAFAKDDEESQKKAFNANKAFGIGQAIISTAVGISNALTAGGNPIKLASGAQFVEAGIVAASGAAQIATISKTQFKGAAIAPTPPPSGNIGGDVGFLPRGFTSPVVGIDVPTTKVIVTETDIRNVSRNVDGVYSRATVVQ